MNKTKSNRKAVDVINTQPPIKFPYHVMRFFVDGSRQIDFAGDKASFGEDYGTLKELRSAIEWLVVQLGGTVKWKKKKNRRLKENKMTEEGDYGSVLILEGEYKDQMGYYDDEEGELAVVYLGSIPFVGEYIEIDHSKITRVHDVETKQFVDDNKEFCEQLDIRANKKP